MDAPDRGRERERGRMEGGSHGRREGQVSNSAGCSYAEHPKPPICCSLFANPFQKLHRPEHMTRFVDPDPVTFFLGLNHHHHTAFVFM